MSEPSAPGLEAQARAAVDRIVALGVDNDTARARAVYAELAALAAAHPEEASLRLWLGWAAFRLVSGHVEPPIAAEAQAVIDDLAAVAAAHPDESKVREELAWSVQALRLFGF